VVGRVAGMTSLPSSPPVNREEEEEEEGGGRGPPWRWEDDGLSGSSAALRPPNSGAVCESHKERKRPAEDEAFPLPGGKGDGNTRWVIEWR